MTTKRKTLTEGERLDQQAMETIAQAVAARDAAEQAVTAAVAEARNRAPHEARAATGIQWDQIATALGMHQPNAVRKYKPLLETKTTVTVRGSGAGARRRG